MTQNSRLIRLIPAVLWTAFIVYALASEPSGVPKFKWLVLPGVDKVIHAILFMVEAGFIVWGVQSIGNKRVLILTLLWCLVLGGGMELVQHFWVDGRSGQMWDLIADVAGGLIGILGIQFHLKNK